MKKQKLIGLKKRKPNQTSQSFGKNSKKQKVLRISAGIIFVCVLILHIALLLTGRSWFVSTILFYFAIAFTILGIIRLFIKTISKKKLNPTKLKHITYTVFSIFALLLIIDLGLRFFTSKYDSYTEKNYGWFYISPFTDSFSMLKHKYYYGQEITEYNTHPINTEYNFKTEDFEFKHSYNELGLRESNNIISVLTDKAVILTLGDSFTEGVGTHQDSTWQKLVETKINANSGSNYHVVNAGISGYDPVQELSLFNELRDKIKPQIVIISISSSDIMDLVFHKQNFEANHKSIIEKQPAGYYFYAWSYLFRAVTAVIYDYPEIFADKNELEEDIQKAYIKLNQVLKEINLAGEKNGFKTMVIIFPTAGEFTIGSYNYHFSDKLSGFCKANDIPMLDMKEAMNKSVKDKTYKAEDLYWQTDGHFTPTGYRLWSEILSGFLIEKDMILRDKNK